MTGVPTYGVVVLTQGTRPQDLRRGLESVLAQTDVVVDVVVVGNGWEPTDLPAGVRGLALAENVGIPAGRNAGVPQVSGDLVFFLDDDASVPDPGFLADAARRFESDPQLGLLQPRILSPDGATEPGRWVPRMRKGDPSAPGPVFSVWEGVVVARRSALVASGGWPASFFYAHEGIELAWRVWDAGFSVLYAGDLTAQHPVIQPTRHDFYFRLNARNRVWLARRNLPAVLVPVYVGSWTGVQVVRSFRRPDDLRAWFGGWREGWREDPGPRRPMRWSTVWRMTKLGRPPVV